jgi:hypothetical protein
MPSSPVAGSDPPVSVASVWVVLAAAGGCVGDAAGDCGAVELSLAVAPSLPQAESAISAATAAAAAVVRRLRFLCGCIDFLLVVVGSGCRLIVTNGPIVYFGHSAEIHLMPGSR